MANVSKGATVAEPTISDFYLEERTFPPSPEFQARALVSDRSLYEEAERDYVAFWARQARELVSWFSDFDTTLEWELPFAKWFSGGTLNISYNCLDRHLAAGLAGPECDVVALGLFVQAAIGDQRACLELG